jgi:Phage integrase family
LKRINSSIKSGNVSQGEIQRVLAEAPEPYRTFYWLAAETGMRAGELCGLRVDDIEFDRGIVNVRQSVWHGKLQDPKSENASRTFAISSQLREHLRVFLQGWRPNQERLVFATRNGNPWDASLVVKRKLRPLLRKLEIQECGLHAFRHTNASLMDEMQVPMKVRQQRLGHSDPRLTMNTYTHMASADDERIAEQLGRILDVVGQKQENELRKKKGLPIGKPFSTNNIAWLRGLDLNQRPPGYEPDELPGCSTPRTHHSGCAGRGQTNDDTVRMHTAWHDQMMAT